MNADGTVVVGVGSATGIVNEAFRWTRAGGMVGLGLLPVGGSSGAFGVNADGSVLVGFGGSGRGIFFEEAIRWTQAGGMVGLGLLTGGNFSQAQGVNADGTVVVGAGTYSGSGNSQEAFRWTQAGGMAGLGFLPGGNFSGAAGVNADGTVVVGGSSASSTGPNQEAFRWTQAGGMAGLGFLPGGTFSSALGVNADGTVVVGDGYATGTGTNLEAFRWTQTGGMQSVQALLTAKGVSTTGWTLTSAQGVSADGQVIVGFGIDPNGNTQGWIARLGVPFLAFNAKLAIDLDRAPKEDRFQLESSFTLSSTASIDPVTEPVTLQVGTVGAFKTTIPPGSFNKHRDEDGFFSFEGVINGVRLEALIKRTGTLRYAFGRRRGTPTWPEPKTRCRLCWPSAATAARRRSTPAFPAKKCVLKA